MAGGNRKLSICHLGRANYKATWDLQRSIQSRLIEAKRKSSAHDTSHLMLTVEHPPVYTLGKNGSAANLLADEHRLSRIGATFEHIDRGGDITFHGPGQLVVYPIMDLGHFYLDIHRYLRELEEVVIRTCSNFNLATRRIDGRTGVWVQDGPGIDRKLCSMGIKCSRWVTCHGLALNISTDLSFFSHIVACGLPDVQVTSMSKELEAGVKISDVLPVFVAEFRNVFCVEIDEHFEPEASVFLERYLSRVNS